jgi:Predicted O-methyltransferase
MKKIKALVKSFLFKRWLKQKIKEIECKLSAAKTPEEKKLCLIFKNVAQNAFSDTEKAWFEKIEKLRTSIDSDTSLIEITDYGAGNPNDNRSSQQMYEGSTSTARLCDVNIASKSAFWAKILFSLIKEFKPQRALELGTCLGISASYQACAMLLNGLGNLITLEGSPSLAQRARKHVLALGIDNIEFIEGRFQDTLPLLLEQKKPFDYVFIDGHHDRTATIDYFNQIAPYLSQGAVLVFDDISWSEGMRKAWQTISHDNRIKSILELGQIGICIVK